MSWDSLWKSKDYAICQPRSKKKNERFQTQKEVSTYFLFHVKEAEENNFATVFTTY